MGGTTCNRFNFSSTLPQKNGSICRMEQAEAAESSSGFNPSPVLKILVSVCAAVMCCEQHDAGTEVSALIIDESATTARWNESRGK